MERLGAPDQGADPKAQLTVGPIGGDQTNTHMSFPVHLPLSAIIFVLSGGGS